MIKGGKGGWVLERSSKVWEIIGIFASSLFVGYSGAMMPGPVTILAISQSARQGLLAAPLLSLGHIAIELVMVIALVKGVARLFHKNLVAGLIGVVGGLVLIWMGLDIVRSAWQGSLQLSLEAGQAGSLSRLGLVAGGVVASLSNPYWLLWWVTIGLSYVMLSLRKGVGGLVAFYLGHGLADFSWNSFVGLLVVSGRRVFSDSVYAGILLVAGCVLIGLSTYFIYSGVNFLRGRATMPAG